MGWHGQWRSWVVVVVVGVLFHLYMSNANQKMLPEFLLRKCVLHFVLVERVRY
jgi:hypothetical protein